MTMQFIHGAPKKGENGGLPWGSSLRQSWNTAPNSKVEDIWTALSNNIHVAPEKYENGGFPWGSSLRQSWNTTQNSKVKDTWTALSNNIHVAPKKDENGGLPWGSHLRQSWNTAPNSKMEDKWMTTQNSFIWLRKRMRMEDCLEGPLLGNHETQLQTLKWRTHEQP